MRGTECKVKGVVFFGTPFRGSVVANRVLIFKELGKYFKLYNVELVRALRLHSKELADIATCFNQVEAKFRIKPIIYYENRRFMNWRKVVRLQFYGLFFVPPDSLHRCRLVRNPLRGLSPLRPDRSMPTTCK